jgi:hypothetical protein
MVYFCFEKYASGGNCKILPFIRVLLASKNINTCKVKPTIEYISGEKRAFGNNLC